MDAAAEGPPLRGGQSQGPMRNGRRVRLTLFHYELVYGRIITGVRPDTLRETE